MSSNATRLDRSISSSSDQSPADSPISRVSSKSLKSTTAASRFTLGSTVLALSESDALAATQKPAAATTSGNDAASVVSAEDVKARSGSGIDPAASASNLGEQVPMVSGDNDHQQPEILRPSQRAANGGGVTTTTTTTMGSSSAQGAKGDKIRVWINVDSSSGQDALKVNVSSDACVGDLLLIAFDLFRVGDGGLRPSDAEVWWKDHPIANRQTIAALLAQDHSRRYQRTYDGDGRLLAVKEVPIEELFVIRRKFSRYPTAERARRASPVAAMRRRAQTPKKPRKFRQTSVYGDPGAHGIRPKPAADRLSKDEVERRLAQAYFAQQTVREQLQRATTPKKAAADVSGVAGVSSPAAGAKTPSAREQLEAQNISDRLNTSLRRSSLKIASGQHAANNIPGDLGSTINETAAHISSNYFQEANPADDVMSPKNCTFLPMWGTNLCGNCGCRKDLHKKLPLGKDDMQKSIIRSSRSTLLEKRSFYARPRSPLFSTSPKRRTPSTYHKEKPVCDSFVAVWGRPNACENCGHSAKHHDKLPADRKTYLLEHIKRPPPPSDRKNRGVCHQFVPLWNHNDFCNNCYHPVEDHKVDDLPSYQRQAFQKKTLTAREIAARQMKRNTLRLCALPWQEILPWCQVQDLFKAAQICRLLTMTARPILEATMQQVMEYEIQDERDDLWRKSVHVAENLAPYSDAARHMLAACLVIFHSATDVEEEDAPSEEKIGNFTYRIDLVKQIACIHPLSLDENAGKEIAELETFGIDEDHDLFPLLVYLRALWLQRTVRTRAQRYLQYEKVFL